MASPGRSAGASLDDSRAKRPIKDAQATDGTIIVSMARASSKYIAYSVLDGSRLRRRSLIAMSCEL